MRGIARLSAGLALMMFVLGSTACNDVGNTAAGDGHVHDENCEHDHGQGGVHVHADGTAHADDESGDHVHAGGTPHAHDDHAGHDHDDPAVAKALAELSADDREAAEAQHSCPVCRKMLGAAGVPCKVSVDDRDVFVCSAGCEGRLVANPTVYLEAAEHDRGEGPSP